MNVLIKEVKEKIEFKLLKENKDNKTMNLDDIFIKDGKAYNVIIECTINGLYNASVFGHGVDVQFTNK